MTGGLGPEPLKACCAAFYEQPALRAVLGDALHPGGLRATADLGRRLALGPADHVLDVACGPGRAARHLAETFGCRVTGLDYSARAAAEAARAGGGRTRFLAGDAERMPFRNAAFDAAVIECSLCLFPSPDACLREVRRVLRPGGRIGVADLALERPLPEGMPEVLAWVACVAGARSTAGYRRLLEEAGFTVTAVEDAGWALADLAAQAEQWLFVWELAAGLGKAPALPVAPAEARAWLEEGRRWIADGQATYVMITAGRPDGG